MFLTPFVVVVTKNSDRDRLKTKDSFYRVKVNKGSSSSVIYGHVPGNTIRMNQGPVVFISR